MLSVASSLGSQQQLVVCFAWRLTEKGIFWLFLGIQLKLNTALLSTVRVSVRVFVCHRRDISHFSHI